MARCIAPWQTDACPQMGGEGGSGCSPPPCPSLHPGAAGRHREPVQQRGPERSAACSGGRSAVTCLYGSKRHSQARQRQRQWRRCRSCRQRALATPHCGRLPGSLPVGTHHSVRCGGEHHRGRCRQPGAGRAVWVWQLLWHVLCMVGHQHAAVKDADPSSLLHAAACQHVAPQPPCSPRPCASLWHTTHSCCARRPPPPRSAGGRAAHCRRWMACRLRVRACRMRPWLCAHHAGCCVVLTACECWRPPAARGWRPAHEPPACAGGNQQKSLLRV